MSGRGDWTEQRIDQLKALYAKNMSYSEIGAIMGVSRESIGGKVARLGLKPRTQFAFSPRPSRPRTPPKPIEPIPAQEAPESLNMALEDMSYGQCQWPTAEAGSIQSPVHKFCGRPVKPHAPYCEPHCRKAYQPSLYRVKAP